MHLNPTITRRALLAASAGGAAATALAACSPGNSSSPAHTSQAAGKAIVALDAVTVGQAKSVTLPDGSPGVVARLTATTAACFSAICTHEGCTVQPAGAKLDCPCHGSQFNALTGAVLHGPAASPLHRIDVTVSAGQVVTTSQA